MLLEPCLSFVGVVVKRRVFDVMPASDEASIS